MKRPAKRPRRGNPAAALGAEGAGAPPDVVRRAPFADSPHVGARGQRTQQRILDAALAVFGEAGYDPSGVDPIAQRAGCSRAAFYQYFSSKEDVFRHLSGQVARQLDASTEALEPVASSRAGWRALRAWVARFADVYDRYQPVFHAFQAASESDAAVAAGSARWGMRAVARIRARLVAPPLRSRELELVIVQLLGCVTRTHDLARILRSAAPEDFAAERMGDALADVAHRAFFGLREDANVRPPPRPRAAPIRFDPAVRDVFATSGPPRELTPAGRETWDALLEGGRKVFAERGYYRTRVADVTAAAGLSRAAFYRYFDDKDQLARALTARALRSVARVFAELPASAASGSAAGRAALRDWLRRYDLAQVGEAAMIRVWMDAVLQDAGLRADAAPALDWGRRALAFFLERRGFGDVDAEAVVLLAHLSAFGTRERSGAEVEAAARIVERGFVGLER